jgi:proteasome assembly chaperone (PAC2) family protein
MRIDSLPTLRSPVFVSAFHGWNDGGSAATLAAGFLRSSLDAVRFATIDPDDYVDFQQVRPRVSLRDGVTRELSWPDTEFFHAALPGVDRDVVICIGVEPNLRWRTFVGEITDLCGSLGVELAVTLGGLLADTPHTRPVPVSGAAADPALAEELGLRRSRYEGPTGIVGVLQDALGTAGFRAAGLWAAVPHYISSNSNPAAALALIRKLEGILGVRLDPTDLEEASVVFLRQIAEVVEGDEETAAYVRDLEHRDGDGEDDEDEDDEAPATAEQPAIPSGDDLAEELQRFLREHREGGAG